MLPLLPKNVLASSSERGIKRSGAYCRWSDQRLIGCGDESLYFCTMGALSDWFNMSDFGRLRQWLAALVSAILMHSNHVGISGCSCRSVFT
jgi:hypothetical protein